MGQIIDGRAIAKGIRTDVKARIEERGITPVLAIISVGENDASEVYIRQKRKAAEKVGIRFEGMHLETATTADLMGLISDLNSDSSIHGILVQLPLPDTIDVREVMEAISPNKDVDGFHPCNYGDLLLGKKGLAPCTPAGIMRMLDHENVGIQGKEVLIVNHSNIIGKPLTLMMLNRNATVSVCHEYTKDLARHTSNADILITAAGVPGLIQAEMVKNGAVVIDVSMNRVEGKLCGDVVFKDVLERASLITPVPGGVGPMTVAMLMENTLTACIRQKE